ncbi:hypothetical protein M501DRAFT_1046037 [Patellaria atrata CBS 101060]|uniref:Uncharacterized protein n=1 Tax=Patellaria atrata CBS 101060 TaxID=1346257 RepID=A0A9P4VPX1_9PEZI|nr:hypothetical protein M501DRAFT_1046037 [Patellaria atrata CBS 101060]
MLFAPDSATYQTVSSINWPLDRYFKGAEEVTPTNDLECYVCDTGEPQCPHCSLVGGSSPDANLSRRLDPQATMSTKQRLPRANGLEHSYFVKGAFKLSISMDARSKLEKELNPVILGSEPLHICTKFRLSFYPDHFRQAVLDDKVQLVTTGGGPSETAEGVHTLYSEE